MYYVDRYPPFSLSDSREGMTYAIKIGTVDEAHQLQQRYQDEHFMSELQKSNPGEYAAECVRRAWAAFEREYPRRRGTLHTGDGNPAHFHVLPE